MMQDTPIETIVAESDEAETSAASEAGDAEQNDDTPTTPQWKHTDEPVPNRRFRRAFARIAARMQEDIRQLGVHMLCGKPYVGPTSNRCGCPAQAVQAVGSITFLATHSRGKHDV